MSNISQVHALDLTITLFLWFSAVTEMCHGGFFSQRITAVLEVLSKRPCMKNSYKACQKKPVFSEKSQGQLGQNRVSIVDGIHSPPSDRMITNYKKKGIVGRPKATTKIHITRMSFQPSHTEENITKRSDLRQLSDLISLTSCKLATFFLI